MKGFLWITFAVGALFFYTDDAKGCSVVRSSQVDPATEVVQGSAVIVRARAVGYLTEAENHIGSIRFSVSEVLRGQPLSELTLHGELVDRDDFNTGRVPNNSVRPNGLSGICYAWQYKAGAEYLLMLSYSKSHELGLSPFPLEPVNEQLVSSEDPWLLWVRKQTKRWRPKSSRKAQVEADQGVGLRTGRPPHQERESRLHESMSFKSFRFANLSILSAAKWFG